MNKNTNNYNIEQYKMFWKAVDYINADRKSGVSKDEIQLKLILSLSKDQVTQLYDEQEKIGDIAYKKFYNSQYFKIVERDDFDFDHLCKSLAHFGKESFIKIINKDEKVLQKVEKEILGEDLNFISDLIFISTTIPYEHDYESFYRYENNNLESTKEAYKEIKKKLKDNYSDVFLPSYIESFNEKINYMINVIDVYQAGHIKESFDLKKLEDVFNSIKNNYDPLKRVLSYKNDMFRSFTHIITMDYEDTVNIKYLIDDHVKTLKLKKELYNFNDYKEDYINSFNNKKVININAAKNIRKQKL